jgi:hypothetical protein
MMHLTIHLPSCHRSPCLVPFLEEQADPNICYVAIHRVHRVDYSVKQHSLRSIFPGNGAAEFYQEPDGFRPRVRARLCKPQRAFCPQGI